MNRLKGARWLLSVICLSASGLFAQDEAQTIEIVDFPEAGEVTVETANVNVLPLPDGIIIQATSTSGEEIQFSVIEGANLLEQANFEADGVTVLDQQNDGNTRVDYNSTTQITTWTVYLSGEGGGDVTVRITAPEVPGEFLREFEDREFTIERLPSVVVWDELPDFTFGDYPISLAGLANPFRDQSPLPSVVPTGQTITYSVVEGPGIIEGNTLAITGQGSVVIRADAFQNKFFSSSNANQNLTVKNVEQGTAAVILDQWSWSNPEPSGDELNGFAEVGETLVAVGDRDSGGGNGRIFTSTDGVSWTLRDSGVAQDLNGITAAGSATGTVTFTGQPADADTITLNGTEYTFKDTPLFAVDVLIGATVSDTIANLLSVVSGQTSSASALAEYTQTGDSFIIVSSVAGTSGNSFSLATSIAGTITLPANLTNGQERLVTVGDAGTVLVSTDSGATWNDGDAADAISENINSVAYDSLNQVFVAVGDGGAVYQSTDHTGTVWNAQVSNTTESLSDVVVKDNIIVAVGDNGTIIRFNSTDALPTWSVQFAGQIASSAAELNGVGYGNGLFVAVGEAGVILSSSNGVSWVREFSSQNLSLSDVVFGNETFTVVGEDGVVVTSLDGHFWTERITRFEYSANSVGFANFNFFSVGNDLSVLTSPNGRSWTVRFSDQPGTINDVAHNNGQNIAVGDGGRILSLASGASTWVEETSGVATALNGITQGPIAMSDGYVAVGDAGVILTSTDGVTWTPRGLATANNLNDVFYDGTGTYVAVGDDNTLATSPDGITWTPIILGSGADFSDVTFGNNQWVVVGGDDSGSTDVPTIFRSSNATFWLPVALGAEIDSKLNSITFFDSQFISVGNDGIIITSSNGITWTKRNSSVIFDINAITSGDGAIVAVGDAFTVLSSTDGIEWGAQVSGSLNDLNGINFGGDQFIATGEFDSILTSTNAINSGLDDWQIASPTTGDGNVNYVIFENNLYVAVGDNGVLRTSTDGQNWVLRPTGTTDNLNTVAFGNGTFVVGGDETIIVSDDGENWTSSSKVTLNVLWTTPVNEIAYGNGVFVAASDGGFLLASIDNGESWIRITSYTNDDNDADDFKGVSYLESSGLFILVGGSTVFDGNFQVNGIAVEDPAMSLVATSRDGIQWERQFVTQFADESFATETLHGVAFGNGRYLVVGDSGVVMSAETPFTDYGTTISGNATVTTVGIRFGGHQTFGQTWNDVIYASGNGDAGFVLVGDNGAMVTSDDGTSFTFVFPGVTENLNGIAYGDFIGSETFIAVGDNGRFLNAADRLVWREVRSSGFLNTLNGVAAGNDILVTVGSAGGILRSTDGAIWDLQTSTVTADLNAVAFGNSAFVAIGDDGNAIFSSDAITWNATFIGNTNDLNALIFSEDLTRFIGVGEGGVILDSNAGDSWTLRDAVTTTLNGVNARNKTAANGTITFNAIPAVGDEIFVNGVDPENTFTFVNGTAGAQEIQIVTGDTTSDIAVKTAVKLSASADADVSLASYSADSASVSIVLDEAGAPATPFTLAFNSPTSAIAVSGAQLTGGEDTLLVAVGNDGTFYTSADAETWTEVNSAGIAASLQTVDFFDVVYGTDRFIAVGESGAIASSTDAVTWTAVTSGVSLDLRSVIFENDNFVATGFDGTVLTSRDGVSWIERPSRTFAQLNDTLFANNIYVSVGSFGTIITSGEFTIRQDQTIVFPVLADQSFPSAVETIALGAVASSGLDVSYSVAGPASIVGNLLVIEGVGDVVVTASQEGDNSFNAAAPVVRAFQIVDSATKRDLTVNFTDTPTSVNFTSGLEVTIVAVAEAVTGDDPSPALPLEFAVTSGSATILDNVLTINSAVSAITVEARNAGNDEFNPVVAPVTIQVVKATQTITFDSLDDAELGDEPFELMASSNDTDNPVTFAITEGGAFAAIGSDGKTVTLLGAGDVTITASAAESDDFQAATSVARSFNIRQPDVGTFWAAQTSPVTTNLNSVQFLNQGFVAVGDGETIITSSDGEAWISQLNGAFTLNDVAYGSQIYVAVGDSGRLLTSTDAVAWQVGDSGVTQTLNAVSYVNSRFVAVGAAGTLITSLNGTDWETVTTGVGVELTDITVGNDLFVISAASGSILRSPDLVTFETAAPGGAVTFTDVAFEQNQFIAVGTGSTIYTSTDAENWTIRPNPVSDLNNLAFGADRFLAVGAAGVVIASSDAIEWDVRTSGVTTALNSVAFTPDAFVAVGEAGVIITSGTANSLQSQEINFTALVDEPGITTFPHDVALSATSFVAGTMNASGLEVTFSVVEGDATVNNTTDTLTVNSAGTVIVRASQEGSSSFFAAEDAEEDIQVGTLPTITFSTIGDRSFDSAALTLLGSIEDPTLAVSFRVVSGPATVAGDTLTLSGATGTVQVEAFVAGREDIAAVAQTFEVSVFTSSNEITTADVAKTFGDLDFDLLATASSGDPVTFSIISGSEFVTLSGANNQTVTINGAGTVVLNAFTAANGTTFPAANAMVTLTIGKLDQSITFEALGSFVRNDNGAITLNADNFIGTSEIEVPAMENLDVLLEITDFTGTGTPTLVGDQLTLTGVTGTLTVTASQSGNDNYNAATSVAQTFVSSALDSQQVAADFVTTLNDIAFVDQQFLAVGESETILTSPDGVTWTSRITGSFGLNGIAYGSETYVAVGASGRVLTSEDGIAWEVGTSGVTANLNKVVYLDGRFIALGAAGTVITSLDGETWTAVPTGFSVDYQDITLGNGTYALVGSAGTIINSTDFENFNESLSGGTATFNDVDFNENLFVAVGSGDTIYTSTDGLDWTIRSTPVSNLNALAYNDGEFIAVGENGVITTSPDGITWTVANDAATDSLNGIAGTPGLSVAVGANGAIVTRGDNMVLISQDINFTAIPDNTGVTAFPHQISLVATAVVEGTANPTGLDVTFSVVQGDAEVNNTTDVLTVNSAGVIIVRASQAGDATHYAADEVEEEFTIGAAPTISFVSIGDRSFDSDPIALSATIADPTLTVSFELVSGPASINGSTLTLNGTVGEVTVKALVAGRLDIPEVTQSFNVSVFTNSNEIVATDLTKTFGDIPFSLTATATSGEAVSYTINSGSEFATLSGTNNATFTIVGAGVVVLNASSPATATFPAASTEITVTINQQSQSIVFDALGDYIRNDNDPLTLVANNFIGTGDVAVPATENLDIIFTIDDFDGTGTPSISGNQLTLNGAVGSITLSASQPGNANFAAADTVSQTVVSSIFATQEIVTTNETITFTGSAAGSGRLVVVGDGGNIAYFPNANNRWDFAVTSSTADFIDITYGNGFFVAIGSGGTIFTSIDGIVWNDLSAEVTRTFLSIVFAQDRFVILGAGGSGYVSKVGDTATTITFTEFTVPVNSSIEDIAFGNDTYVAVGALGVILSSTDGEVWTERDSGHSTNINSVAFGDTFFLAVGDGSTVLRSTDGITWVEVFGFPDEITSATNFNSVGFGTEGFILGGDAGLLLQGDGLGLDGTWTLFPSVATQDSFADVSFVGGRYFAVGTNSNILETDQLEAVAFFSQATVVEDEWLHTDWLGFFNVRHAPWLFHAELEWLYTNSENEYSIWMYNPDWGWIWTNREDYPWFYCSEDDTWYWFHEGSGQDDDGVLWFYNGTTRQWVNGL